MQYHRPWNRSFVYFSLFLLEWLLKNYCHYKCFTGYQQFSPVFHSCIWFVTLFLKIHHHVPLVTYDKTNHRIQFDYFLRECIITINNSNNYSLVFYCPAKIRICWKIRLLHTKYFWSACSLSSCSRISSRWISSSKAVWCERSSSRPAFSNLSRSRSCSCSSFNLSSSSLFSVSSRRSLNKILRCIFKGYFYTFYCDHLCMFLIPMDNNFNS